MAYPVIRAGTNNHSNLINLDNDDHLQYHNDIRGDIRYYTQAQIDSRGLDTLSDVDIVTPTNNEVLTYNSTSGNWENSFSPGSSAAIWGNITGTLSDQTDLQSALDLKANQTDLDSHTADATIHYTEGSISHLNILDTGNTTHTQIDAHVAIGGSPLITKHAAIEILFDDTIVGSGNTNVQDTMDLFDTQIGLRETASTGVISGGRVSLSQTGSPAITNEVDITSGAGEIVDGYTDRRNPTRINVNWNTVNNFIVDMPNALGAAVIYVDSTGIIQQQSTTFTANQRRTLIQIALIYYNNGVIDIIQHVGILSNEIGNTLYDWIFFTDLDSRVQGMGINPVDNVLEIWAESGKLLSPGMNIVQDITDPNIHDFPGVGDDTTGLVFDILLMDSTIAEFPPGTPLVNQTEIPKVYESSPGVVTHLPGNDASIHYMYRTLSNRFILQLGQNLYTNGRLARDSLETDRTIFTQFTNRAGTLLSAQIYTDHGASNFNNSNNAGIVSLIGSGAGASGGVAVTDYISLSDVVDTSYVGQAGNVPNVNISETGLEFTNLTPLFDAKQNLATQNIITGVPQIYALSDITNEYGRIYKGASNDFDIDAATRLSLEGPAVKIKAASGADGGFLGIGKNGLITYRHPLINGPTQTSTNLGSPGISVPGTNIYTNMGADFNKVGTHKEPTFEWNLRVDNLSPSVANININGVIAGFAPSSGFDYVVPAGSTNVAISGSFSFVGGTVFDGDLIEFNIKSDQNVHAHSIELTIYTSEIIWGDVTGTLSNQLDLQSALDLKADDSTVDPHIADATLHFTENNIVHQNISGAGTNDHAAIDSHILGTTLQHGAIDITYNSISTFGVLAPIITSNNVQDAITENMISIGIRESTITSILSGGEVTASGSPLSTTNIDIAAGQGHLVNSWDDATNPTQITFTWNAISNLAVSIPVPTALTTIYVDSTGTIGQKPGALLTNSERRSWAYLAVVFYENFNITLIQKIPRISGNSSQAFFDYITFLDQKDKVRGLAVSEVTAALSVWTDTGKIYESGINWYTDKKDPNIEVVPAHGDSNTPAPFNVVFSDGSQYLANQTVIPKFYESGSPPTAIALTGTESVIHYWYQTLADGNILQLGTQVYVDTLTARGALNKDLQDLTEYVGSFASILTGQIYVGNDAVDFSDVTLSGVLNILGGGGGGGAGSGGGGPGGASTYLELTDVLDTSYSGKVGQFPQVDIGEVGLQFVDIQPQFDVKADKIVYDTHAGDTSIHFSNLDDLADVDATNPGDSFVIRWSVTDNKWVAGSSGLVKINVNDIGDDYLEDNLLSGTNINIVTFDQGGGNLAMSVNLDDTALPRMATIGGDPMVVFTDTTRANKILSSETQFLYFAAAAIADNDWLQIQAATDALSGYVMPFQGTIVGIVMHCSDTNGNTKDIELFINGTNQGSIGQLTGTGEQSFTSTTFDINFIAGDKIRLRAASGQGIIQDTNIQLRVKWRL